MQHIPATIEEQLLLKAIKEECPWESLPKRLQAILNSKEEWHRRIIEHCIKKRLQWNTCFARKVCKEGEYYEEMMRYLRRNLALFPYHLVEYVCRVMRVSPFRYYCDMIFEVMKNEQPYDSIPNFSAADALRLTGIGRNEFIDIMNKCRSKKIMWKLNKSIAKELLPTQPVDFVIEPWWGVCLVNFTLEEFKKLSEEEMATIDKVCKEEANAFILFDPDIVKGLYRRGLIYFEVPVYPDDRFKEQCERDRACVLVHCMSGKNRSPAIVIAYLMKSKGWRLAQSYQWVKERRPSVELTQAVYQQLQEYEQKIFNSIESNSPAPALPVFQSTDVPSFSFGFPKPNDPVPAPAFNNIGTTSIFARPTLGIPPQDFTFGAAQTQNISESPFGANPPNPNGNDIPMEGS